MKAKVLLLISTAGFIIAGAAFSGRADDKQNVPPAGDVSAFQAATNIVVSRWNYEQDKKEERFIVSDRKEVRKLVSSIRLKPGVPLRDEHVYGATFQGPSGEIVASICPRCFTIHGQGGSRVHTYQMPSDFYAEFRKLARQHGWKVDRK